MKRSCIALYAAGVLAGALVSPRAASADPVIDWNRTLIEVMLAEKSNPLVQSRNAALVHTAMFDAVNSSERRYAPYQQGIDGARGASAQAAAAMAAHRTLFALYPKQRAAIYDALTRSLAGVAPSHAKEQGIAVGERSAARLLQLRSNDNMDATAIYITQTARGAWVPNPGVPPLGVHWGSVTPWVLDNASQFRPGPPPDLASGQFKRDYLEVKEIGGKSSTQRTAEQTQLANFWISSGPVLWSQVAQQLSTARGLSIAETARVFALLHMAGADALTACWDAKYTYHNFRPITAIRTGTGRDDLPADAAWEPAIATPPFPAYVSGHACYSGAALAVLGAMFGHGEIPPVTIKSPTAAGFERKYSRLIDIATEASNARIWGGIHWRTDQIEGEALGKKVGEYALSRVLLPLGNQTVAR